jgi:Tfp pilus assembly protein FimV
VFAAAWETFGAAALAALVTAGAGAWFVRRKTDADTADIITQAAERAVKMLEKRIAELEAEQVKLRERIAAEQNERAALNLRLATADERERNLLLRVAELQAEVEQLRLRIARYENPIVPPKEDPA